MVQGFPDVERDPDNDYDGSGPVPVSPLTCGSVWGPCLGGRRCPTTPRLCVRLVWGISTDGCDEGDSYRRRRGPRPGIGRGKTLGSEVSRHRKEPGPDYDGDGAVYPSSLRSVKVYGVFVYGGGDDSRRHPGSEFF